MGGGGGIVCEPCVVLEGAIAWQSGSAVWTRVEIELNGDISVCTTCRSKLSPMYHMSLAGWGQALSGVLKSADSEEQNRRHEASLVA